MRSFLLVAALLLVACDSSVAPEEGREYTLYVSSITTNCVGMAERRCMLVRETTTAPWTYFYDSIEGFTYESGYSYELRVKETPVRNPPADGSSFHYTLTQVVSKTAEPVPPRDNSPGQTDSTVYMLVGSALVYQTNVQVTFKNTSGSTLYFERCMPEDTSGIYDVMREPGDTARNYLSKAWACVGGVPSKPWFPGQSATLAVNLITFGAPSIANRTGVFRIYLHACVEPGTNDNCKLAPLMLRQSNAFRILSP